MDEKNQSCPVQQPAHYAGSNGIEAISAIRASMDAKSFQAYCKGNVLKYLWRHESKNGIEDIRKAQVYLGWLADSLEAGEPAGPQGQQANSKQAFNGVSSDDFVNAMEGLCEKC